MSPAPLPTPAVVPRPESLTVRPGHFALTPETGVRAPAEAADAAGLARELLGVSGSGDQLRLRLVDEPALGAEGYRLKVTEDGVEAHAAAPAGLRWAVQTLRQLAAGEGRLPCVEVLDRPRFGWRGSLLDVARWCHPLPFLYRYVDLLALHKLNTLHLHLTDDQGWRFEVRKYPLLTEVGGFRAGSSLGHADQGRTDDVPHGGFYTQEELRDLVRYAGRRGVRVMPEIDAPGHMQAAVASYPWLGNRPDRRLPVRRAWGVSRHVLNVSDAAVDFVCDVLDELTDVFPFEYVHIGGDEVPTDEWEASADARRRIAAEGLGGAGELVGWWASRLAGHLAARGRRAAVWDELLERGVPAGAAVFAWQGLPRVDAGLRAGHDVVAAPYEHLYLDWAEGEGPEEPLAILSSLPLERVYAYRPPETVLGVQGHLWSEYLPTPELVEWRAFPRLAAVAEVGWSGAERDHPDFRRRLSAHLPLLDRLGVHYRPPDPPTA
ncbi:beta-N-acetylhexosaminidase [Phaeacidiphilus oryzae]|uniref:beta-N-acetylhexosaminidase n=1 Tax=Phaeacidiphilus oryzae TaxID=348818 RepID=UPI0005617F14|nr:beta-N-acetylhexosaminidase [Phaeacidiphilus oryzae]